MVREILEITGGVLVEDKCPRGLTEESVDRIRKGIGTGDRSASLQHDEMEGAAFLFAWAGAVPRAEESLLCYLCSCPVTFLVCTGIVKGNYIGKQSSSLLLFLSDEILGGQCLQSLSIVSSDRNYFQSESCQVAIVVCSLQYRCSLTYSGIAY